MSKQKKPAGGLNIIIVGCGKVGTTLVEQLVKEGHDITIVDKNAKKIQELSSLYDIMGIVGNGASFSIQQDAGIENADLIIAVTESDELNLLCCTLAKRVAKCSAIARVRTPDYSKEIVYLREKLGLAMVINPELEASREASRILCLPTALEVNTFANGQAELIKYKIPEGNPLVGTTIAELSRKTATSLLICAVEREGEIYIPSGDFTMKKNDVISFCTQRNFSRTFFEDLSVKTNQVKNTMIIGGGKAAYYLAKRLIGMGINVKIIENDRQRCEDLSVLLPKAIIINGDGTDEELLKEEGIEYAESFVALTGIDEENILLTLHARQVSNAKTITKINRINFKDVISRLDLGSVVYPRYITSEAIIAYVRAKNESGDSNIETLYHLFDHRVEAIEFKVDQESEVTGTPLQALDLKRHLLVAFINRNGKIIIPSGQDTIERGDTVMVVTTHTGGNMNSSIIRYILGNVMRMEACFLLLPCIVSLVYGEGVGLYYLGTAIVCLAFGVVMAWKKPKNYVFYLKEGCIATSLSWIVMSLVGCMPFWISGEIPSFTDAMFETVSGFTTTGASILTNVEALSHTALFGEASRTG